jgi:hypothetical protein
MNLGIDDLDNMDENELIDTLKSTFESLFNKRSDSSVKLDRELEDLRLQVKEGKDDKREELLAKFADALNTYTRTMQFDETINTMYEMLELGKKLAENGKTTNFGDYAVRIGQAISTTQFMSDRNHNPYKRVEEMFNIVQQWMLLVPAREFEKHINEWARNIHEYVKFLIDKKHQYQKALDLIDDTITKLESKLNTRSTKFVEWQALFNSYHLKGELHHNLKDESASLQNYLRYDELADKAHDVLMRNKPNTPVPISQGSGHKIFIANGEDDNMSTLIAARGFQEDRQQAMFKIGNLYEDIHDITNASKYYDKAARVARIALENDMMHHRFLVPILLAAKPRSQFYKARLYAQIGDLENATKFLEDAEKEIMSILKEHLKDEDFEINEFEKLQKEINDLQKKYNIKIDPDLANAVKKKYETISFNESKDKLMDKVTDALNMKLFESTALLASGQTAFMRKNYKSAIFDMLRARNILDSQVLQTDLIASRSNLLIACAILAKSYTVLGDPTTAVKWSRRGLAQLEVLEKKFAELEASPRKTQRQEYEAHTLKQVDINLVSGLGREVESEVNIALEQYEKAIDALKQLYEFRKSRSERKKSEANKSKDMEARDDYVEMVAEYVIKPILAIEECYCSLGQFDNAIKWCNTETETYAALCTYASEILPIANIFRSKADFSLTALLLCAGKIEQADAIIEQIAQKFVNSGVDSNIELAKERVDSFVALRRSMLMSMTEFREERLTLIQARKLTSTQPDEAAKLFNEVLQKLETKRKNAENEHRIIRKQWDMLIKYTNIALDFCNGNENEWDNLESIRPDNDDKLKYLRTEEKEIDLEQLLLRHHDLTFDFSESDEEDPDGIDEEIEKVNYDFEYAHENPVAPEFAFFPDNEKEQQAKRISKIKEALYKHEQNEVEQLKKNGGNKVGRNDPCPCGSGKKYKKCCMLDE